jgi:hypothetical protein
VIWKCPAANSLLFRNLKGKQHFKNLKRHSTNIPTIHWNHQNTLLVSWDYPFNISIFSAMIIIIIAKFEHFLQNHHDSYLHIIITTINMNILSASIKIIITEWNIFLQNHYEHYHHQNKYNHLVVSIITALKCSTRQASSSIYSNMVGVSDMRHWSQIKYLTKHYYQLTPIFAIKMATTLW